MSYKDPNLKDKPFEHLSHNGTNFRCETCDLRTAVFVTNPYSIGVVKLGADFAEFAGWHAANILPYLNGFAGYDTIVYQVVAPKLQQDI